jgi:biopolymer transport protein ExbD
MRLKMRNKVTPEFTMAAMTDFVFQLLIIFMLISTLATESESNTMDVNLPTASVDSKPPSTMVVALDAQLNYFINGQPVQKDQLVGALKQKMPVNNPPTVQLAIDETVQHKYFVELVDLISVQNHWKIGIQTKEPAK